MSRHSIRPRRAFTLVELLIVIAIIALLVAMLIPVVGSVRGRAKIALATSEMSQVGAAIQAFKTKMNAQYIPATQPGSAAPFRLRKQYTGSEPELIYLKSVWPNLPYLVGPITPGDPRFHPNGTGLPDLDLDPNQCLVFFLTGGVVTNHQGFSTSKIEPFVIVPNANTIGPFLEYNPSKFDPQGHYLDPWGTPYAYFTSIPGQKAASYLGTFSWADEDGMVRTVSAYQQPGGGRMMQEKSFQIISAGSNRAFGPGGNAWTPGSGFYDSAEIGGDDVASFKEGTLTTSD